ncbi:unnamed protein product [Vitrella brassicaformis CCMP3155]|uniref:Uncharacterized protein n=1 Tax=Vitrella brassicaformis (strain CCMP3155) TaxID=1169540 RepID=A0A0G4GEX0_VITBC|nr:unnamed protein product [Vitrella brassicaformis CCMP3155]|mmetsp:Transcript_12547/g.36419  ORF Transcript_12547/g.36419 Transcript_12547/m.36419 type:complete len:430 (+) Transcript_12547:59-1348(+)|eukprot:CEM28029.1 unnamed protein product [Vitrella brassicaformis CCMP3155]
MTTFSRLRAADVLLLSQVIRGTDAFAHPLARRIGRSFLPHAWKYGPAISDDDIIAKRDAEIYADVSSQVRQCFGWLMAYLLPELSVDDFPHYTKPPVLSVRLSPLQGLGVFAASHIRKGTVACLYPGYVWPSTSKSLPASDFAVTNVHSRERAVIDGEGWLYEGMGDVMAEWGVDLAAFSPGQFKGIGRLSDEAVKLQMSRCKAKDARGKARVVSVIHRNPLALGNFINHPPKGAMPNVAPFAFDYPYLPDFADIDQALKSLTADQPSTSAADADVLSSGFDKRLAAVYVQMLPHALVKSGSETDTAEGSQPSSAEQHSARIKRSSTRQLHDEKYHGESVGRFVWSPGYDDTPPPFPFDGMAFVALRDITENEELMFNYRYSMAEQSLWIGWLSENSPFLDSIYPKWYSKVDERRFFLAHTRPSTQTDR